MKNNKQKHTGFFARMFEREKEDWSKIREKGFLRFLLFNIRDLLFFIFLYPIVSFLFDYLWGDFNWPGIAAFIEMLIFTYLFAIIVFVAYSYLKWKINERRYKNNPQND